MKKKSFGSKGPTDGRRVQRVEREIQQTIARYLISGFREPLPGIVTVAQVKMPADLRAAKVYVSVLGEHSIRDEVVEILNRKAYEVQNFIGKELKMRYCPKLSFLPDEMTEQILKVEKIFKELEDQRGSRIHSALGIEGDSQDNE